MQLALWGAAFWLALWQHRRDGGGQHRRFAIALLLGALAARAGSPWLGSAPPRLLAQDVGFSLLFLPLGPLLLAREPAAFTALCPALALARLGCVVAGCCVGRDGEPLAALEALAFLALRARLRSFPHAQRGPAFVAVFGVLRLAESPWRPASAGAALPPGAVAAAWALLGSAWTARIRLSEARGLRA